MSKVNYKEYIKSARWNNKRKSTLFRDNYTCKLCNAKDCVLDVHHNTYERLGNENATDLITICRECHSLHHKSKKTDSEINNVINSIDKSKFKRVHIQSDEHLGLIKIHTITISEEIKDFDKYEVSDTDFLSITEIKKLIINYIKKNNESVAILFDNNLHFIKVENNILHLNSLANSREMIKNYSIFKEAVINILGVNIKISNIE